MGSLSSSPKTPVRAAPAPIVTPSVPATAEPSESQNTAETAQAEREQNLLRRTRGRLGTISTGLRGFLSEKNEQTKPRKTLLGE